MITLPRVIEGEDILSAWTDAYRTLRTAGNRFNLALHVRNPLAYDLNQVEQFDPRLVDRKSDHLRDVATTIFPRRGEVWSKAHADFRDHYVRAYKKMLDRGRRSWGCYFLRMVQFGAAEEDQLERVINGLSSWGFSHKAAFIMHMSSVATDKPRPLGAPCLQYVQFLVNTDDSLSLTAVYRSHDYFRKALGNLVGLTRLLDFVALRTEHQVGTLSCLSTYAYIDVSSKKADALLAREDE